MQGNIWGWNRYLLRTPLPIQLSEKWAVEFKLGKDCREDDPWSGHPQISPSDEQVDVVHPMVLDDRCFTVQQMTKSICISSGFCFNWNLGDKQAVCKMGPKNGDAREQPFQELLPA